MKKRRDSSKLQRLWNVNHRNVQTCQQRDARKKENPKMSNVKTCKGHDSDRTGCCNKATGSYVGLCWVGALTMTHRKKHHCTNQQRLYPRNKNLDVIASKYLFSCKNMPIKCFLDLNSFFTSCDMYSFQHYDNIYIYRVWFPVFLSETNCYLIAL